jgi:two-component system, chemotaxis family, sensor kinase Cph1
LSANLQGPGMITLAAHSGQTNMPDGPAPRVLVVEDEYLIATLVCEQLVELGYSVVGPALSAADARRLAISEPIDCALLDWELAGDSSGDVADILQQRRIPYFFVTGYAKPPDARHRQIALLSKPFGLPELQSAVESAVHAGARRAELR